MSTWTSIRDTVEKYLPYAGAAVNPALGAVLATALGTKPDPDSVLTALTADPAAQEKLLPFEVQLKQIVANQAVADHQAEVALVQADVADRASARQLATSKNDTPQIILSAIFVAGYFGLVYELVLGPIRLADMGAAQLTIVTSLMGVLTASVLQIVNFWFGSSHGSQKKDDAISSIAQMP
jgi:hypothetical protein